MKTTLVLATLAAVIASPALAQSNHHRQANVPQWNTPAAESFGLATRPSQSRTVNPRGDIYVNGYNEGTDPDALVREQLLRDPPHGG